MANAVYANGMEIACKAGAGKVIAAFPDVCMTPPDKVPPTPPGIPIPYPNTAMASDTTDGSKSVKISDEEVMLKNKSCFKTSTGDEAGCAAKKGLISSKNKGKVYFIKWSMNVKFEGENVDRHFDMTTNNHGSPIANEAVPWVYVDQARFGDEKNCQKDREAMDDACEGAEKCPGVLKDPVKKQVEQAEKSPSKRKGAYQGTIVKAAMANVKDQKKPYTLAAEAATAEADGSECVKKSRCYLRPYTPNAGEDGCCPGQSAHHIPPFECMNGAGGDYSHGRALCICLEGHSQSEGSHGKNHAAIEHLAEKNGLKAGKRYDLKKYVKMCATAVEAQCGCDAQCIEDQLNEDFKRKKITKKTAKHVDTNSSAPLDKNLKSKLNRRHDSAPAISL